MSLQTNPWLEGLDLGSNPIGPDGAASLCDALQANPYSTLLCCAHTHVGLSYD